MSYYFYNDQCLDQFTKACLRNELFSQRSFWRAKTVIATTDYASKYFAITFIASLLYLCLSTWTSRHLMLNNNSVTFCKPSLFEWKCKRFVCRQRQTRSPSLKEHSSSSFISICMHVFQPIAAVSVRCYVFVLIRSFQPRMGWIQLRLFLTYNLTCPTLLMIF